MSRESAKQIEAYSFLVAFARDGTLSSEELQFIERLVLRDGVLDDGERLVLHNIFAKVPTDRTDPEVLAEISRFRQEWRLD